MSSARVSAFASALPVALYQDVEAALSAVASHCPLHCITAQEISRRYPSFQGRKGRDLCLENFEVW